MCACALIVSLAASLAPPAPPADRTKMATPARIAALVRQLGDDRFETREAASRALAAAGEPALDAVFAAASSKDAEVRRRAAGLMVALRKHALAREWKALAGRWSLESRESEGGKVELKERAAVTFAPGGRGSLVVHETDRGRAGPSEVYSCEIVGPYNKPAALNLGRGGGVIRAIYRVEGDRLLLCLDNGGGAGARPTSFSTQLGDGRRLITLKRIKPAGPSPEPPASRRVYFRPEQYPAAVSLRGLLLPQGPR